MEAAIEAGAEDVIVDDDGSIEVLTSPDEFEQVRDAMIAAGSRRSRHRSRCAPRRMPNLASRKRVR